MIRISNIEKYYNVGKPNEIHVLDDVTYEFPEFGMCAVFGPSGCGKTTLLNVIGGLDRATSGEVSYDGTEISADEDRIRNRDIGFIFQNYNLNREETVFDNVADSLRLCGITDEAVTKERVMAALDNVGMGKFSKRLPDTLSGGQQQRVAIARAIVKNPRVILADEPTGNLDEANTILVMDILKTMAKEHLVILVTHESKLVDFYCDTVIDLSDGRIAGTRENENTRGYVGRNRNDIYLGELEKSGCGDANASISYYGDPMEEPVRLTIVHKEGRVYLRVDSEGVTILEDRSEIRLKEGVFEERPAAEEKTSQIDMSKLPQAEGTKYGRLFRLRDSIVQGYRANFGGGVRRHKKQSALITCMFFFGVVLVFFTAVFGTKLRKLRDIRKEMNYQIFMVYGADKDISDRIAEMAADPAAAIDYHDLYCLRFEWFDVCDTEFVVQYASFETFGFYDDGYEYPDQEIIKTMTLPVSIAGDKETVCGRRELLDDNEVLITTQVADRLLEHAPYRFIDGYEKLLGLPCYGEVSNCRIVGIIRSDENSVYISDNAMRKISRLYDNVTADTQGYFNLAPGECALICARETHGTGTNPEYTVGDTLRYNGILLTMKAVEDITALDHYMNSRKTEEEEEPDPEELARLTAKSAELADAVPQMVWTAEDGTVYWRQERIFVLNPEDYENAVGTIRTTSKWILETGEEFRGTDKLYLYDSSGRMPCYRLHSTDPDATREYLAAHFSDISCADRTEGEISSGVITPKDRFTPVYNTFRKDLMEQVAILVVFFVFFCICMYLVMRASVMNRTREIGIYRAIGAKKSNVVFRFAVEAAVVLSLSAVVGFLIISVCMGYFSNKTEFSKSSTFYYPLWMAVALFVFLMVTGIVSGILPVIRLLRKTPSEILAKYDI